MSEQEKTEESKPEETTKDSEEGNKYETTPIIERAREEREKLEAATKAQKEENDRTELIMAKKEMGGETEAGTETTSQYSAEQLASRKRIKAVADASGSSWGKNYE